MRQPASETQPTVDRPADRGKEAQRDRKVPLPNAVFADDRLRRRAWLLLSPALLLLVANAFVPIEEFVHRGDDAFYYFKVAINYPQHSFWTFDGIHSTNGVQPLWAMILTGIAQLLSWVGVDDPNLLARVFVGVAAVCHFAASMLLFHLLAKTVSVGTGITAAGAFLFPWGIVWARVWGMENSLYALMLLSAVSYCHLVFRRKETVRAAAVLGLLLGLTALSRLNAGLLIPVFLGYYLLLKRGVPFAQRLRLATIIGAAASALLIPYLVANLIATGYPLPISGIVKDLRVEEFLAAEEISSRFSLDFLSLLYWRFRTPVEWFLASRALDGAWIAGARVVFAGAIGLTGLAAVSGGFVALPALAGRAREWFSLLGKRFRRLSIFSYLLIFGIVDAVVSVYKYPTQLSYAMPRWWFVENEIIVVVLMSALVAAAARQVANRWIPLRWHLNMATVGLVILIAFHTQAMITFYWDGEMDREDWNRSWNDESYRAALWISENVPEGARVGSWNAGVLGYYADRSVVNLDGLINNADLLPFIRQNRVDRYLRQEGIAYLSDMGPAIERSGVAEFLELTEVYSSYSEFARMTYKIYRVEQ